MGNFWNDLLCEIDVDFRKLADFRCVDAIVNLYVMGGVSQHTRIHSGESSADLNVKEMPAQIVAMLDKSRTSGP